MRRSLLNSGVALLLCLICPVGVADLDLGENNWRWGKEDTMGAGNHMTPDTVKAALAAIRHGKIIELSHDVAMGAPHIWPLQTPYIMTLSRTAKNLEKFLREHMGATNQVGFFLERIEMTTHVSTHIDALGHATIATESYNGLHRDEAATDTGLTRQGIEQSPPFIARAVLIDVAAYKNVPSLEPGYAITPEDLQGALKQQGSTVPKGAVVYLHTGWGKNYTEDPERYAHTGPGIGLAASKWLAAQNVLAIGADNMALEVTPGEDPTIVFPVHQHLLVKQGIYIIENVKTDQLAAEKRYNSTTIMLPTKLRGATGTPLRIIALY